MTILSILASLCVTTKDEVLQFIQKANQFHATIKFTAEISNSNVTSFDTTIYKGERFKETGILGVDVRTHSKPTEKFQYTHFKSSHPPGVKKGFVKGEALRLLWTNSSRINFEEQVEDFKTRLQTRGYQENQINNTLAEVSFDNRSAALQQKLKTRKKILPFACKYRCNSGFGPPADLVPPGPNPLADLVPSDQIC